MQWQHSILTGIDTYMDMDSSSAKTTTICGLAEYIIYHHGIAHSITYQQGTHLATNKGNRFHAQ
jgi:hypothetical protein